MAAGDIITSKGYTFTPEDVELFVSSLVDKIQSTAKDPEQYELVTMLDQTISSLPVFKKNGNTIKLVRILMTAFKGDPFTYADFTPEQLQGLALTFEKLTPEQVNILKIKLADLTPADIASLQKPATDAAAAVRKEMTQISQDVSEKTADFVSIKADVKEAIGKANTSASVADKNAKEAEKQAGLAAVATKSANDAAVTANKAGENANKATIEANTATVQVIASLSRLIPSSLAVSYPKRITFGNKSELFVKAILAPDNVMQNVIFIGDNKALTVAPDGRISVIDRGQSVVHVIPTCNTALAKSVLIEVGLPTIRLVNTRKKMRLTSTGALRLN